MDEKLKEICSNIGVYYEQDGIRIFACRPTDEALPYLEIEDGEKAQALDIWGGDNLYILQWYGDGVRGVRKALLYLKKCVGDNGIMAGMRHGRPRRWTKEFLKKGVRNG